MKITAIQFSDEDIYVIYNYLINAFNEENKKQVIDVNFMEVYSIYQFNESDRFSLSLTDTEYYNELCNISYFKNGDSDLFSIESVFELYHELTEPDERNQCDIANRFVYEFRITVYFDGEEIGTNLPESDIDDKIRNHYKI